MMTEKSLSYAQWIFFQLYKMLLDHFMESDLYALNNKYL